MCTLRDRASSVNGMYCFGNNENDSLFFVRSVTEVLWDVQYSLFSLQKPEYEGFVVCPTLEHVTYICPCEKLGFCRWIPAFSGIVLVLF
jgi:hypothetical protein